MTCLRRVGGISSPGLAVAILAQGEQTPQEGSSLKRLLFTGSLISPSRPTHLPSCIFEGFVCVHASVYEHGGV